MLPNPSSDRETHAPQEPVRIDVAGEFERGARLKEAPSDPCTPIYVADA